MMRRSWMTIAEGERVEWWQGLAWHDYARAYSVVLPIPLNFIAGAARKVWFFLHCPPFFQSKGRYERYWIEYGRRLQREEMVVKARYNF